MYFRQLLAAVIGLAATVALGSGQATAQDDRAFLVNTTQDLHILCTMPNDAAMRTEAINYCMAYMDGAVDYHDVLTEGDDEIKRLVCYPDTATLELGVITFIEWGESNKGDRKLMEEPPVLGVLRALSAKWPC